MTKARPDIRAIGPFRAGPYRIEPEALSISGPSGTITLEPKVMDVLLVLAARRGEVVLRSELIEAVWAVEHGGDESLTRAISILRKALGDVHGHRALIETVPRRGYRLIADPPAGEEAAPAASESPPRRPWVLITAGILATAVLVGGLALRPPSAPPAPGTEPGVIAIGDVSIAGDEASLRELADALPVALSSGLSRNGLRPVGNGAAERSDVQYRLTGSVSRQNEAVRSDLHLTDPASDHLIWSFAITVHDDKIARLPEFTAVRASQMLRCLHDLRAQVPAANTQALILLREICDTLQIKPIYSSPAIRTLYSDDPSNPGAKALAAYAMASTAGVPDDAADMPAATETRDEARRMAEEVLAAHPDHVFASLTMAALEAHKREWVAEEAWLLRANRQPGVRNLVTPYMVTFLRRTGRLQEAAFGLRETLRSHPSSSMMRTRLGWLQASMGNFTEADKEFAQVQRSDPLFEEVPQRLNQIALFQADPRILLAEKRATLNEAGRPPDTRELCQIAFLEEKLSATPNAARIDELCVQTQTDWRLRMFTQLGDLDRAYAESAAFITTDNDAEIVIYYPDMAPFRNDPRFWEFASDLGLADYWRETRRWPDFCRERNLPQPCRTGAEYAARKDALSR